MTIKETKTLDQLVAEQPNVDVSKAWERCYGQLWEIGDRVRERFKIDVNNLYPTTVDRDYYTSQDGALEGSFKAWSNNEVDWLVNSWIGNRKASVLDMNCTVFLGQQIDVPHMVLVFGTVPHIYCYADFLPRSNLATDEAYLNRYYEPMNERWLKLRGDERLKWMVSHGSYMRAILSPVSVSLMGPLGDELITVFSDYIRYMADEWFKLVDQAEEVPMAKRAALQANDFKQRELGYRLDPMNKIAAKHFGDEIDRMVTLRMGTEQMKNARKW